MIIQHLKCDECGAIRDLRKPTIELRRVTRFQYPQVDRAEIMMPYLGEPSVLSTWEFCNKQCLLQWLQRDAQDK